MAADGDITMAQLRQITERLRSKLDELESAMANQAIAVTQQTFDAASEWSEASLEKKRKLLSQLVDVRLLRVGRNAGRNFDPDSVEVTLKSHKKVAAEILRNWCGETGQSIAQVTCVKSFSASGVNLVASVTEVLPKRAFNVSARRLDSPIE
jgi:hypothetical protein